MGNYVLSCCSTVDLTHEHLQARNISYTCFHYFIDGKDYPDDLGRTMSLDDFYAAMTSGADVKTSQINAAEYMSYFEPFLAEGKDILHMTLSSGLSGSYMSACGAAQMLSEKYPERKIRIVDSLGASSGSGMLIDTMADMRDEGKSLDEVADWAEENRLKLHHWFFSTDLTFYVKGGRVSKTAGAIGGLLGICPLLNMDYTGHLIPREKIRPKKRVIARVVEMMREHADGGENYNGKCYICHSASPEDAKTVSELVVKAFPHIKGEILINNIGTTIGSHSGPGTVALFFWGDKRIN